MQRYIGLDVHAVSCTLAVIAQVGKRLQDLPVETNGQALVEAVRRIPSEITQLENAQPTRKQTPGCKNHRRRGTCVLRSSPMEGNSSGVFVRYEK